MPRIKWIGIIQGEIAQYQEGELNTDAKKLDMPSAMNDMMLKALPFAIPSVLVLVLSMLAKTFSSDQVIVRREFLLLGFFAGFLGLILHEFLHAMVYPKEASVCVGWYPKAFAAVALASYPMKRDRFVLMSLLPLVLGVLPILVFWISPAALESWNSFWFGLAIMGLISPYTDCYNVYQVLRQTPKGCYIQFYGDDMYWMK